jgi:hypothetical protein
MRQAAKPRSNCRKVHQLSGSFSSWNNMVPSLMQLIKADNPAFDLGEFKVGQGA